MFMQMFLPTQLDSRIRFTSQKELKMKRIANENVFP